jgi:hypothetical protein
MSLKFIIQSTSRRIGWIYVIFFNMQYILRHEKITETLLHSDLSESSGNIT